MPVGYIPIYRIYRDDQDITDKFNDRTTDIEIALSSGGSDTDRCTITLDNRDFRIARPEVGIRVKVYMGYEGVGLADCGSYELDTVEFLGSPHSIRITGTSVGFAGTLKAPAFKAHDNRTVGEIIDEIAKKGDAKSAVAPSLAGEKVPFFNQTMSPLHMLQELERRFGAIAKFEDGYLIFNERGSGQTAHGENLPLLVLQPEMFGTYSVRHTERTRFASSRVSYLDTADGLTKWVDHKHPNPIEIPNTQDDTVYVYGKQMRSQGEAKAMAKSIMNSLRRQQVEATFTLAKGDPWVRDQMPILVRKMCDGVNGSYLSELVTHKFTKDVGISTTILAKTPNTENEFVVGKDDALGLNNLFPGGTEALPDGTLQTSI